MTKLAILGKGCISEAVLELNLIKELKKQNITRVSKLEDAEYLLYITCAGVGDAIEECITDIETIVDYKKHQNPKLKIIITGCLTKISSIFKEIKDIDGIKIITNSDWIIPVFNYINDENKRNSWQSKLTNRTRYLYGSPIFIQFILEKGCTNHCSFCKTNYLPNKVESVPYELTLEYLRKLIRNGAKHIALSGDNLCLYGIDLYNKRVLHKFIQELSKEEGLISLCVNELSPQNMYSELLEELVNNPKVKSVSMQIETASDPILDKMNRTHTLEQYDYYVRKLKEKNKFIDTVLMSGFPTETYEDLAKTIHYLSDRQIFTSSICQYVDFEFIPSSKLEQLSKREKISHTAYLRNQINEVNYQILNNYIPYMHEVTLAGIRKGYYIFESSNHPIMGVSKSKEYEQLELGTVLKLSPKRLVKKSSFNNEMIYKY